MRRALFQRLSENIKRTGPFRNGVKGPTILSTLPKRRRLKWMQLGDKIALRALTLRVRVKSDRNAQAAR